MIIMNDYSFVVHHLISSSLHAEALTGLEYLFQIFSFNLGYFTDKMVHREMNQHING